MTRPDGGDGDGESNAKESAQEGFDDVWGALVDSAAKDAEAKGATKAWTEEVRAELKRSADKEPEAEPVVGTSETKAWTEEVRGERKQDASASSSALLGPDPGKLRASAEDEMARLMNGPQPKDADADAMPVEPPKVEEAAKVEPAPGDSSMTAAVVEVRPAAQRREAKVARPVEEVRARRVDPRDEEPEEVVPASPNRTGLWVAAIVAIAVVGYFVFGRNDDPKPTEPDDGKVAMKSEKRAPSREGALANAREPAKAEPTREEPTKAEPTTPVVAVEQDAKAEEAAAEEDEDDDAEPTKSGEAGARGDPREVPAGTAPANAAVFSKLPIGPGDRPPIGGVGRNGAHVDRIATGSTVEKARCSGDSEEFSAAAHDHVNVCFRVVHARQKEDLVVLWQKDGGTVRRGKVVVPAVHAYRTRAYLVMRKEYVGRWTVRILDLDGTELASHPFAVVE